MKVQETTQIEFSAVEVGMLLRLQNPCGEVICGAVQEIKEHQNLGASFVLKVLPVGYIRAVWDIEAWKINLISPGLFSSFSPSYGD